MNKNIKHIVELLNIAHMGFAIKATDDLITTQQEEHQYHVQIPQSLVEKLVKETINIVEAIQHEDVPTSTNLNQEAM
jgi:hypothetical protein